MKRFKFSNNLKTNKKAKNFEDFWYCCQNFHSSFNFVLYSPHIIFCWRAPPLDMGHIPSFPTLWHWSGTSAPCHRYWLDLVGGGKCISTLSHTLAGLDKIFCIDQLIFGIDVQQLIIAVIFCVQGKKTKVQYNEAYDFFKVFIGIARRGQAKYYVKSGMTPTYGKYMMKTIGNKMVLGN